MNSRKLAQPFAVLNAMTDAELRAEKLAYKIAIGQIEDRMDACRADGEVPPHELKSARRHYQQSLGLIGDIAKARNLDNVATNRLVGELYRAVGELLVDDSDAAYERLRAAYVAMPQPNADRVDA